MRVIGVSGQDDLSEMEKFVNDYEMAGFEHIADVSNGLWQAFDVSAQPSFIFINDDGAITRHIGGLSREQIAEQLDILVAN